MKLKIALLLATTFGLSISFAFAEASNKDKLKLLRKSVAKKILATWTFAVTAHCDEWKTLHVGQVWASSKNVTNTAWRCSYSGSRSNTSRKIDQAVKDKIKSMQDQEQEIKLNVSCTTCSSSFIELLKQIKGLDIIKVDSESKTIALKLPANLVQKLAQYTGVFKIRLYGIPQASWSTRGATTTAVEYFS